MNFSVGVYRLAENIKDHPERWDLDDETFVYSNADGAEIARFIVEQALRELEWERV